MFVRRSIRRSTLLSLTALLVMPMVGCLEEGDRQDPESQAAQDDASAQTQAVAAAAEKKAGKELSQAVLLAKDPTHAPQDREIDEADPRSIEGYEPEMHWSGEYSYTKTDIVSHDGIKLRAVVTEPAGPGPHPLIVMPSSWALNRAEYSIPARLWAKQGFVVVSFTSRGFHRSGGVIDIAGAPTVKDVSSVIDWAGKHTKADLGRVGALGISYGGGISLLAAAKDPRIDAVATMSGWADLRASMIQNDTASNQMSKLLTGISHLTGKPGKMLHEVPELIKEDRVEAFHAPFAERSAIHQAKALEKLPVFIAQGWNDGAFPVSQMLDFYKTLKGPKSIVMQPGDHATADLGGLLGLSNRSWDGALKWMKRYVKQEDVKCDPAVVSISNDNKWVREADSLSAWEGEKHRFTLSDPWRRPILKFGAIEEDKAWGPWSRSIETGRDTVANSGTVLLTGAKLGFFSLPELISPTFVLRHRALMWRTPLQRHESHIVGTPVVKFNIKPQAKKLSLFVYLYEEVAGVASLVSHAPITFRDLKPGQIKPVSVKLQPTDWHLVPGSKMVVIVDTKDPRYVSQSQRGRLEILSTQGHPASIEVPMHVPGI